MTQNEKRMYLIEYLLSEQPQYEDIEIPADSEGQAKLLRSLMNIRLPYPIGKDFLKVQDEYLKEEVIKKGIVDADKLESDFEEKRIVLWKGDITTLKVDAIVNAANSALRGCFVPCHSCIDNIIHTMSGIRLRLECDEIMKQQGYDEPTGSAKITSAYNLPSEYVIHTVGPIITGNLTNQNRNELAGCYKSCLKLAGEMGLKSIAFCCISTGEFRFPKDEAAKIAVSTVKEYLKTDTQLEKVIFNVFKQEDFDIYKKILK